MQRVRRYSLMVVQLVRDLLVVGWGVGKRVVLPGRNGKGNLLWSLFLLFTSLVERLIAFFESLVDGVRIGNERVEGCLRVGKKYLRLGVLMVTWGLCMLAALEWSGAAAGNAVAPGSAAVADSPVAMSVVEVRSAEVNNNIEIYTETGNVNRVSFLSSPLLESGRQRVERRWLLLRTLRI